ncbi:MAG: glycosyltransferase [Oscillospiraceae bacterium]|nr:glycosyltransferase [Oscillospiraceae bacterium]
MFKVTVVVTTYNLQMMIAACFDELLSQTFQDFNVLVVDDCSTDKTADIVREYIMRFPERIDAIFLEQNLGSPSRVRNTALDSGKINGEYVIFLDGDDSIEPVFLETLFDIAKKTNADITLCVYDRVDTKTGRVICVEMQGFDELIELPSDDDVIAFFNVAVWNKLIKTKLIEEVRFPDFCAGEDLCFFLQLYIKCKKIALTDKVLLHYRVRSASVTSNTPLEDIRAFAMELLKLHSQLQDGIYKDITELLVFIHIGVSMTVRATDNTSISACTAREYLLWTRAYLIEHFRLFKNSRFLRFGSLKKHGIRGWALWTCLLLYKLRMFGVFIFLYKVFRKYTNKDIKF